MKRFTGIEIAALILAAVLFFGGASLVIWPQSGLVPHDWSGRYLRNVNPLDSLDPTKSRLVGAVGIVLGAGLAAFTIYGGKT